jgi:hypothetical protein
MQPRIRGSSQFYLFKNGTILSSFSSLGKRLNEAGIPILLLKGAALKAIYDTEASRCLSDVDFAVPKRFLKDAVEIAERQGYQISNRTYHSVDMKQPGVNRGNIDIHYRLFKTCNNCSTEEALLEGSERKHVFGVDVWIASPENLLTQLLENEFFNLWVENKQRRRFKWIYDCGKVLSSTPHFDFSIVATIAKKYSIYDPLCFMLTLLQECLPEYVPHEVLATHFPKEENVLRNPYVANVVKWRFSQARRAKWKLQGKKWKALLIWPSQMAAEYRFLKIEGDVLNFREFLFSYCKVNSYREVVLWILNKFRAWN